jgi:hypothetical protein
MTIAKDTNGSAVVQITADEAFDVSQGVKYGMDTKIGGGWVLPYRKKLDRLQKMLRYAHQQIEERGSEHLDVSNHNLARYAEQLESE